MLMSSSAKSLDNEEFGFWSVGIVRPLRLAVEISGKNLELLKAEKDEELYKLMCKAQEKLGGASLLNYGAFQKQFEFFSCHSRISVSQQSV